MNAQALSTSRHQSAQSKYSIIGTWRKVPQTPHDVLLASEYHVNFGIFTFNSDGTYTDVFDSYTYDLRTKPATPYINQHFSYSGTYTYNNLTQDLELKRVEFPHSLVPIHFSDSKTLYWQDSNHFQWANTALLSNGSPIQLERAPGGSVAQDSSPLKLNRATTKDASSVTVDYSITGSTQSQPIDFKVYRSSTPDPAAGTLLGDVPDATSSDLSPGPHSVTLLKGTDLPPDTKHPYVVVVGSTATGKSTTYFRKWRLATVAHGYAGYYATDRSATSNWVKAMGDDLKGFHYCDDAIQYLWLDKSVLEQSGMTAVCGADLAMKIRVYIAGKANTHPGDVVDLLMIGHSRGTVVTSEALNDLRPSDLTGSNVHVVLLDCHPASDQTNDAHMLDFNVKADTLPLVKNKDGKSMTPVEYLAYFQHLANDHEIVLPAGRNIKKIDVWWQKTETKWLEPNFIFEGALNLFGIGEFDGRIANNSGVAIDWKNLTTSSTPSPPAYPVGHEQVHDLFKTMLEQLQASN